MLDNISDSGVNSAVISATVTISLFILKGLFSTWWSKHFLSYKINFEHNHEQKKKIKEAISKYKMPLLNSAEHLNHRFWNFSNNCDSEWSTFKNGDTWEDSYYLKTFCYRFLAFHAWCLKFERELVYIDSTLADKKDLIFVKYIKMIQSIICDASIFNGTGYNNEFATDHFFKDDFIILIEKMYDDESHVIDYSEFVKKNRSDYNDIYNYISSISIRRIENKWMMFNCFHYVLMAFLSEFGYDYQKTSIFKLYDFKKREPDNSLVKNLKEKVKRSKLNNSNEMKKVLLILEGKSLTANIWDRCKRMKSYFMNFF